MTTLNDLLGDWDSFIRGIYARRKLTKLSKLWEKRVQEEGRITNREEKLNDHEDQSPTTHTKIGRNKRKNQGSPPRRLPEFKSKRPKKYYSSFEFYSCHKMGHIAKNYPLKKNQFKKKNRKYHAHETKEKYLDKEMIIENEGSSES